jgi:hypothetical protein
VIVTSARGLAACRVVISSVLLLTVACGGSDDLAGSPLPPAAPPPAPTTSAVASVLLTPDSVALPVGGQQQFSVQGHFNNGTYGPIAVTWAAAGGKISAAGLFVADSTSGISLVIAADPVSGKADTSQVIVGTLTQPPLPPPPQPPPVPPPPPSGPYQTLAGADWRAYPDKAALAGQIGVEGGRNTLPPALPVEAFYDLVPDPVFGKVVRYNGAPSLNTTNDNQGRIATHGVGLGSRLVQPSPAWLLQVEGGGINFYYPTDVWVSQFIRLDPWWTTADYKAMFLRYRFGGRHEFKIGTGGRRIEHAVGNPAAGTFLGGGLLPITNIQTMDQKYGISGFPSPDDYPMHKAAPSPPMAPSGNGNGEWYQIVIHHQKVGHRRIGIAYWRQYTVGGVMNPRPWKIEGEYADFAGDGSGIDRYEMGINRNDRWPAVMNLYWGPYEVVDGSRFPNPWNLPSF